MIRSRLQGIGTRIEGIRNRGSHHDGEAPSRSQSDGFTSASLPHSFSQLQRLQSADGFLMVDEDDAPPSSALFPEGEEDKREGALEEEEEEDHMTLDQHRGGGDEDIADADIDDLVASLEDDEPTPGAEGEEGGVVKSKPAKKREELKPWQQGNKEVYEQQLDLLQEQLMKAMLENQTLQGENAELKGSKEEARQLRRENAILTRRLQTVGETSTNSDDSLNQVGGASVSSPKLKSAARKSKKSSQGSNSGGGSFGGSVLTVSSEEDGYEAVSMSPDERIARQREEERARKKSLRYYIIEWIYEFIADFTEEQSSPEDEEPEQPLSAKKLKDNLQRLSRTSKPWQEFGWFLQGIIQWKNTAESLVVFLIYMYCVWHGWIISILVFLAILMLTYTYLRTSGLAEQFGFKNFTAPTTEKFDELRFGDKLQLVKKVAQTCQNKSELVSDSLEKAQNLFLWHQPAATRRVYTYLCVFFTISILLPNSYVLTMIGLFLGIKLFIIDNIYRKYPKVKERYDNIARMWKSLPTDAQLLKRQSLTEEQMQAPESPGNPGSEDSPATVRRNEEEAAFCARFQLPPGELPLPSWQTGKRCSVMDRDRPLTLTRSGRLYLTQSYLCFERQGKSQRDPDRFQLSLLDVVRVVKAKPFAVLPGSGMSIEVTLKGGGKHLFSAILNRDQAYQSILDQGMILGLPWGTNLDTVAGGGGGRGSVSASGGPSSLAGGHSDSASPDEGGSDS